MKKVKAIIASLMITTLLMGSVVTLWGNVNGNGEDTTIGMITTQDDPKPIGH